MTDEEFIKRYEREAYLAERRRRQRNAERRAREQRRRRSFSLAALLLLLAALTIVVISRAREADRSGETHESKPVTVKLSSCDIIPLSYMPAPEKKPAPRLPEPEAPEVELRGAYIPEIPDGYAAADWTEEAEILAKTVYGEARGCSVTGQAAVIWCVLNRVDDPGAYWPDDIIGVVTQPEQFHGYREDNPVLPELFDLALDIIDRWQREKLGDGDVGRILPPEYLYFHGDGARNHYATAYRGGQTWDWSLPSPYEEGQP